MKTIRIGRELSTVCTRNVRVAGGQKLGGDRDVSFLDHRTLHAVL